MSSNDEPFANGFGVFVGIAILWIGTLALCLAGKAAYDAFFGADGEPTEATTEGELQSRAHAREARFFTG
jgi:hypothetical protein